MPDEAAVVWEFLSDFEEVLFFPAFFDFLVFSCYTGIHAGQSRSSLATPKASTTKRGGGKGTHLLPAPHRPKTVKEADILEQIRIEPKTALADAETADEEDEADDGHGEEGDDEEEHAHAQVPDAKAEFHGPEGEEDEGEDDGDGGEGVEFGFPLRAFV